MSHNEKKISISFGQVKKEHEGLVLSWLNKAHVKKWFHGDGLKNTIAGLKQFITNDKPCSELWIAYYAEQPFAYLITSVVDDKAVNADSHLAKWVEPGKKMRTLDLLIGEEKFLGKGLAVPLITEFIEEKLNNSDIIFIDPEKTNSKAIYVYKKSGFEEIDEFIASWNPVPHVLMRLERHN